MRVHEAVQSIEPTVVNEAEARLPGVPVLSPALLFERLTTDPGGRPVEYVHSLYRGDRYRIVSRLTLGDVGPDGGSDGDRPEGPGAVGAAPEPAGDRGGHHPGIPPGDLGRGAHLTGSTSGDVQ